MGEHDRVTRTEYHELDAPSLGGRRRVAVHGHWGRPVLWFPSQDGGETEFADAGLVDALGPALDAGLIKVYCVPSYDEHSWSASWMPLTDRVDGHRRFEDWIIWQVVPFIRDDCGGRDDIAVAGPSLGAFQAVLFALRHAHVFGRVVALSGNYDPWSWRAWGPANENTYLACPLQFLPPTTDGHLDFLRSRLRLTLVVGSGQWEDTTGAHDGTYRLADVLRDKRIDHEFHVWPGWPHDWPSWQAQAAVYLPALD